MSDIQIREIHRLEDFQACVRIQKLVWGFDDPYDIVPLPLLIVSKRNDGIVLGAFDDEKLIGFVYSLPGRHQNRNLQWSHMLAVLPEYRNSSIGYDLKMAQYRAAQEMGYELIEWTFDPLESKNAHFNMKKLGCIAHEYEINIYGETSSPLHLGSPTDRLISQWPIPTVTKVNEDLISVPEETQLTTDVRFHDGYCFLRAIRLNLNEEYLYIEIPPEIQKLKSYSSDAARQWRLSTREIFTHYLARNYVVYSFYRVTSEPSRSFYVLKKVG